MKTYHIFVGVLFIAWSSMAAPTPPKDSVVKPTFMTGYDSFSGGTAFLCRIEQLDLNLILTAHHLFGPACGWEKDFAWDEIESRFEVMTGLSMGGDYKKYITSSELVVIPGARGVDEKGYDQDICAWKIPSGNRLPTLELADKLPKKGDPVYLFARERGSEVLKLFKATVVISTTSEFEYGFDKTVVLGGTSGAPVLNEQGKVVAINIGGYENKKKKTVGIGNPQPAILKMLKGAVKK